MAEIVDDALRHLSVVILTTSAGAPKILKMYRLHSSPYIFKPVDLEEYLRVMRSENEYWFTVVMLPGTARA
ncbi:MAG: hypothetical protein M3120_04120 [Pseudomonadota bacterium]|nr:hypothetical protein [Pseudomonadota bacterium]